MNKRPDAVSLAHGTGEGQQTIAVSGTSAASANAIGSNECVIYSSVECFALAGTSPTATVAAGTPIPANQLVRLTNVGANNKIALIAASGTGNAYIRPGA